MRWSERRRRPTLQSRLSAFGASVVAAWLLVLTAGFGAVLHVVLHQQADATVQARAEAVASTVVRAPDGMVGVVETDADTALDAGVWVYDGTRAVERSSGSPALQAATALRAASPGSYGTAESTRLYSMKVEGDGMRTGTVVAATSLNAVERATTVAIGGTSLLAALTIVAAYIVLRLATARALRPVHAMSSQAATWSEHARPDRFGQHQRYRELNVLAHNFDALLDRLAAVLRHERQLAGELSHELRTPLSRIMGEADLLVRTNDREGAHAIRAAAESMTEILETLLTTARMENTRLPGSCSLSAVLGHMDQPPHAVVVHGDADILGVDASVTGRILAPILDNAHRYARTRIAVDARRVENEVMIDVSSDGPAIPGRLYDRVFDPGFRADELDGHDGAGLGLPLARRLARAADGDVRVIQADLGTTVRVVLPPG